MKYRLLSLALTLFSLSHQASAHSVWIAQEHGKLAIVYGEGANSAPYDKSKLTQVKAWVKNVAVDADIVENDGFITVTTTRDHERLSFIFDNHYFSKLPNGKYVNRSKDQTPQAVETGHYVKYSVAILDERAEVNQPTGLPLEIVPLNNPLALKLNDVLDIQVFYQGKPLANAKVQTNLLNNNPEDVAVTDGQGKAKVLMVNGGLNVLEVSHKENVEKSAQTDFISMTSTLSFRPHFSH